ncbi:hypothetical protein [Candidatus Leptofilum sp.]|uniref:hypothetical protein n=1 Tax=Candidatus Leptofilum sp. TaxID=3241576 RepID=UPI003B59A161
MSLDKIRGARTDISKYLIHWTKEDTFWAIIRSGFFIATAAPRLPEGETYASPTIREKRAVCFSETPIGNYLQSIEANSRYAERQWGIAIPKKTIYFYGGRPVLYGDRDLLQRLDSEDKYLFCHFRYPTYPDWTHEREWRACVNVSINNSIGICSNDEFPHLIFKDEYKRKLRFRHLETTQADMIIPFHLNNIDDKGFNSRKLGQTPEFVIIVREEINKQELADFVSEISSPQKSWETLVATVYDYYLGTYRTRYLAALQNAKIIAIESVKKHNNLWRLEDLLDQNR